MIRRYTINVSLTKALAFVTLASLLKVAGSIAITFAIVLLFESLK